MIISHFAYKFSEMNKLVAVAFCLVTMSFTTWQSSFDSAKQVAQQKHELILLNFSGSDWCGPCIRMRKEIFDNEVFSKMADTTLVLVNADFPRNKKNELSKDAQKQNDALADKYNSSGIFPFTLLIDANGKVVKSWQGLPKETVDEFTAEVKKICDDNK